MKTPSARSRCETERAKCSNLRTFIASRRLLSACGRATIFFSRAFSSSSRRIRRISLSPIILGLPLVERCCADARSQAQVFDRCPTLGFSQHHNDLLFAETTPLHTPSPLTVLYPEKLTFAWNKFGGSRSARAQFSRRTKVASFCRGRLQFLCWHKTPGQTNNSGLISRVLVGKGTVERLQQEVDQSPLPYK